MRSTTKTTYRFFFRHLNLTIYYFFCLLKESTLELRQTIKYFHQKGKLEIKREKIQMIKGGIQRDAQLIKRYGG